MQFYITTEQSVTNWLASFGLSLVGGILAPLLFEPRTTELKAWSMK